MGNLKDIILGIDVGTSSCKIAAFGEGGEVIATVSRDYDVDYPGPGWAEQDPDVWWDAICSGLKEISLKVDPGSIRGIGVDGQSWSAVAVDKGGLVLCPTPIWMDTRAHRECDFLRDLFGGDYLFEKCKNPLSPSYTGPKVLWYRENLPDVFKRIDKVLQSNSFIVYRLTGKFSQDKSQGYGWFCYDMADNKWDKDMLTAAGISGTVLPEIFDADEIVGTVSKKAALATGLLEGTPVVAGGLDAACGTLGVGVIHSGETQEQGGQAGGMSICIDEAKGEERLILSPHVVRDKWLLQGGTTGGGGAINWFCREFGASWEDTKGQGDHVFKNMDAEARGIPAGCEGVIFLPYLSGERSPIWDPHAKGVFYGLSFKTTRAHMARSVMEGVAYSLRHNLEVADAAGATAGLMRSMGGSANSSLWMQIKADITGKTFEVPSSDTATALGAALLAGVGVGLYSSFDEAVSRTIKVRKVYIPNPENAGVYERGYRTYLKLYEDLKSTMSLDGSS